MQARLPTVVVPVFNSVADLDACVASLDRTLPAGCAVLVVDDASSDPRVEALARGWCQRSPLTASYVRRESPMGLARNLEAALAGLGDADVVVLDADSVATPGWLQQISAQAARVPRSATLTPWSNGAGLCSFPRFADGNPVPDFPEAIAEAAASLASEPCPELPLVAGPCLFLRRDALRQLGGLDGRSFPGTAALEDFSRRAAAMGWSNQPCPSAFVVSLSASVPADSQAEGQGSLATRWPACQEEVARFILADPMRLLRERLQTRIDELARSGPQRDLFN